MENTHPPHPHHAHSHNNVGVNTNLDRYRSPGTSTNPAFDFSSDPASSPLPHVNLASMASTGSRRKGKGIGATPLSSAGKATPRGMRGGWMVEETNLEVEMDMARMQLISPPPEEVLRRGGRNTNPHPFTPSVLTNAAPTNRDEPSPGSSAKRKRSLHSLTTPRATQVLHAQRAQTTTTTATTAAPTTHGYEDAYGEADELGQVPHGQGWTHATPNPRSRKQVRRAPQDEGFGERRDGDGDVQMASPTKSRSKRGVTERMVGAASASKGGKGKGRRTRESPAYEPPPETYVMPIRHTTLSPPPPSSRKAAAPQRVQPTRAKGGVDMALKAREKGKGRESIREEMEDEEDGDPLLLSGDSYTEGEFNVQPLVPPGWIIRTPSRTTPKRSAASAGAAAATATTVKRKKVVRTPGKTPGSTVRRKVTVELGSTSVREAVDVVLQEELGDEEGELGRVLEKRRSVAASGREGDVNRKGGPLDFSHLPPSSPPPEASSEGGAYEYPGGNADVSEEDSVMHLDPEDEGVAPVVLPDLAALNATAKFGDADDGWDSDEDSDEDGDDLGGFGQVEGTGEYTGRWRMLRVRTKEDPPSEATLERMEEWGRPVSPYPGVRRLGEGEEGLLSTPPREEEGLPAEGAPGEVEKDERVEGEDEEDELPVATEEEEARWQQEQEREEEAARTPRRRTTLDVQKIWEDAHSSPPPRGEDVQQDEHQSSPRVLDAQQGPPSDEGGPPDHFPPSSEAAEDPQQRQPSSDHPSSAQHSSDQSQEEEEAEEAEVVRLSLEPEDGVPQTAPVLATPKPVYPSPSASKSPDERSEVQSSPVQQVQSQRQVEARSPVQSPRQRQVESRSPVQSPRQRRAVELSPVQAQRQHTESPIHAPRLQEVRGPTFPETPKGAFAFESSSPGKESYEEEEEEEEYLVAIKGSEGDLEFEEEDEDVPEEDIDEDEDVPEEDIDEDEDVPEEDIDEDEDVAEEDIDEDEDVLEEDLEEDEEMDEEREYDVEDNNERREPAFTPAPQEAFAFQNLSSPAPASPATSRLQASQAMRRLSQDKPIKATPPTFRLDVVPPSSPAQRSVVAPSPARDYVASSSPEHPPRPQEPTVSALPETPAPRPFQARRVPVKDTQREQEQADDDEDALEEAIVEELATPKNMKELPYYDHYTPIHRTPFETTEHAPIARDEVEDGDGGEDSESDLELGMVKIISADPRAAARAAAILKQYDYECYTKLAMKQLKTNEKKRRYSSYSSVDDLSQSSIRRSLLGSGVSKSATRETAERERKRRRSSLGMGVIGDTVVIPGSPVVTLPQLLEEVEKEVQKETPSVKRKTLAEREAEQRMDEDVDMETPMRLDERRLKNPLGSPVMARGFTTPSALRAWNAPRPHEQETPWTKEEWKVLDSCLTDERLDGVSSPSMADMKPVDAVDIENVVGRFVAMVGGEEVLQRCGEAWSRDMLRQRVKALQKKQRAGNIAPPSTPLSTPAAAANTSISALGGVNRLPSMEVPDFTPLGRRAMPPRRSRPSTENSRASADTSLDVSISHADRRKDIPATLLAPRYSHLLDEARAINAELSGMSTQQDSEAQGSGSPTDTQEEPERAPEPVMETPKNPQADPSSFKTPTTSFRKRLSGIFFSYMPTLTAKTAPPPRRAPREAQPGLPLPPPEILQKSRAVKTPAKAPLPKPVPPKELVELHPPPKPSMIPRWNNGQRPKHMVPLNHVPPPQASAAGGSSSRSVVESFRPRRSSGASVKDLVKGFEELGARAEEEGRRSRPNSSMSMRSERGMIAAPGTLMGLSRPGWRRP